MIKRAERIRENQLGLAIFRRKKSLSDIGRSTLQATDVAFCGDLQRVHSRALGLLHKRSGQHLAFWPNRQINGVKTDSETALNEWAVAA